MKRAIGISALAVLALAACGKKETAGPAAPSQMAAAPEAAPAPMTPPRRKVGLWEHTMHMAQMTQTSRICFDDAVNDKMSLWGQQAGKEACKEQSITPKLGGGWTFHSVCEMGSGGKVVSDGETSGDFNSHYTVKVKSVTTGAQAAQMNGDHEMTLEATWKGPCPADFKPGDMEVNGMKINMLSMTPDMPAMKGHRPSPEQIAAIRKQMEATIKAQHDGR